MPYNTKSVISSPRAYQVFREIAISKKGSYSQEIADKLGIDQPTVSEIISNLKKSDILKKNKSVTSRAQYYQPDYEGIAKLSATLIRDIAGIDENNVEEVLNSYYDSVEKTVSREHFSDSEHYKEALSNQKELLEKERDCRSEFLINPHKGRIPVFFEIYVQNYVSERKESTIKSMLVDDLAIGASLYTQFPEFVLPSEVQGFLFIISMIYVEEKGSGPTALQKTLEEMDSEDYQDIDWFSEAE